MNRRILSLVLVLAVVFGIATAQASPEDYQGQILPDFSVTTISGETFTLSESLKTHDLVLINFWATWCGPCQMEFPYLEEAWEQYGSRVDVIALSVEEADTHDVLTQFANDLGLRFPMGRDESNMFGTMGGSLIPTTIIVDKDRRVLTVEIGSKSSAQEFTSLFDSLLTAVSQQEDDRPAPDAFASGTVTSQAQKDVTDGLVPCFGMPRTAVKWKLDFLLDNISTWAHSTPFPYAQLGDLPVLPNLDFVSPDVLAYFGQDKKQYYKYNLDTGDFEEIDENDALYAGYGANVIIYRIRFGTDIAADKIFVCDIEYNRTDGNRISFSLLGAGYDQYQKLANTEIEIQVGNIDRGNFLWIDYEYLGYAYPDCPLYYIMESSQNNTPEFIYDGRSGQ